FLYVCDRGLDRIVKWDIAGAAIALAFPCGHYPMGVLATGSLVFVSCGANVIVYDEATGVEVSRSEAIQGDSSNIRVPPFFQITGFVLAVNKGTHELIYFDAATGLIAKRVVMPLL